MSEVLANMSAAEIKKANERERKNPPGPPISNEPEEICNVREKRQVVSPDGIVRDVTSWVGKPSEMALVDSEVSRMHEYLQENPVGCLSRQTKSKDSGKDVSISVYEPPFKCAFCDEEFKFIDGSYVGLYFKAEEVPGVPTYRKHLAEKHLDDLAGAHAKKPADPMAGSREVVETLSKENKDLKEKLLEQHSTVGELTEAVGALAQEVAALKKRE
jgi:hypothetical protein